MFLQNKTMTLILPTHLTPMTTFCTMDFMLFAKDSSAEIFDKIYKKLLHGIHNNLYNIIFVSIIITYHR